MKRHIFFIVTSVMLLTSCAGGLNPFASPGDSIPRTWLDKPLPNSQYTLNPIHILVHASAPKGVSALAFSVNGQLVETISIGDKSQPLVTIQHVWTPSQTGDYILSFTAQGTDGTWGGSSEVLISVLSQLPDPLAGLNIQGNEVPPTTRSISPTTVPPTAISPTAVPPTEIPPTVTPVPDTENPVITDLLWSPITPNEDQVVSFAVTAQDNVGIARIEIFFIREGSSARAPLHVCEFTSVCDYVVQNGFNWGNYTYFAVAYDIAGNQVNSFTQAVLVLQVIK